MISGSKIATGAVWMMSARIVDRLVGVVSTMILARLLVPADFGLVAMAMAVISLIELSNSFGFEIPLLRAKNPGRDQYDTVWTLNLAFGIFCAAGIALAAIPTSAFYKEERLVGVMLWLAFGWLVGSTANIGIVDFRRNLDFAKEFQYLMATRVATFAVTIPCALYFRSYWALIAGMVTGRIATTLLSYAWHPYRPRPCLRAMKELFAFSAWIFVDKIAAFGNARVSDFILGRLHGPASVGVYRMGEEIGYLPGSELVAPLNRALLPGAFRMTEQGHDLAKITRDATGIVAMVLAPACLGIFAVAEPMVRIMLGTNWLSVVPILEVLAIQALVWALWANQHTLLFAAGFPKLPGVIQLLRLVVLMPLVVAWAPEHAGLGVAWAVLISSLIAAFVGFSLSLGKLRVTLSGYVASIWRPLLAAAGMYAVVRWLHYPSAPGRSTFQDFVELVERVGTGAVAYILILLALYFISGRPYGAERLVIDRIRARKSAS
jgi:O-antigen/teichoic acid export membrane protein